MTSWQSRTKGPCSLCVSPSARLSEHTASPRALQITLPHPSSFPSSTSSPGWASHAFPPSGTPRFSVHQTEEMFSWKRQRWSLARVTTRTRRSLGFLFFTVPPKKRRRSFSVVCDCAGENTGYKKRIFSKHAANSLNKPARQLVVSLKWEACECMKIRRPLHLRSWNAWWK